MLQSALDKKDTALLGMELEKVWQSNVLANSQQHANALQDISDRLTNIETPQKQRKAASPEPRVQTDGPRLSPLFHGSTKRSPLNPQQVDVEREQGGADHVPVSFIDGNGMDAAARDLAPEQSGGNVHASDDGACSQEGDENALFSCESVSLQPKVSSTPGRIPLGVLKAVENVLGQCEDAFSCGGSQEAVQLGSAAEPPQDVEKQQNSDPAEHACGARGELDRVTARAEEGERRLTLATAHIAELQEQCKQLKTQLEGAQLDRASDIRRMQAEIVSLRRKLGKTEQVGTDWSHV